MLLIEQINETMLSFLHESRIVYVTIIDADLTKRISELVQVTQNTHNICVTLRAMHQVI